MSVKAETVRIQGTTSATPLFQGLGLGTDSPSSPVSLPRSRFFLYTPSPRTQVSASPTKRPHSSPSPSPPHPTKKPHLSQTTDDFCIPLAQPTFSLPSSPQFGYTIPSLSPPRSSQQGQYFDSPSPLFALPPSQSGLFRLPGRLNGGSKSVLRKSVQEPETTTAGLISGNLSPQSSPHSNLSHPLPRQISQTPPSSAQQVPVQDSSPSQSSAQQQTSAGGRPRFFGQDANVRDDDPFAPLPDGLYDGYDGAPSLTYWDIADNVADEEFFGGVGKAIADFMDKRYTSFIVLMSHVGYTRHSAAAAILVIGKDMAINDATEIRALFLTFQCTRIQEVFCYAGDSDRASDDHTDYLYAPEMREYAKNPDSGFSIGPVNSNSSCTLGVYVQLNDDPSVYALTVHHGVSDGKASISPLTAPKIKMSQPSFWDHRDKKDELERTLADAMASDGVRRPHKSLKSLEKEIKELRNEIKGLEIVDTEFGEVAWSEIRVVRYKDADVNVDWALIKVKEERIGRNYALKALGLIAQRNKSRWIPRDLFGVYFSGLDDLDTSMVISKTGRRTGSTEGKILHRFAYVKLDPPTYTMEYVVVNNCGRPRFSNEGDSGSAVFDTRGRVCGMVLAGCTDAGTIMIGMEHLGRVCVSYITPMPLILERIKNVTGKDAEMMKVDVGRVANIVAVEEDEEDEDDNGGMHGVTDRSTVVSVVAGIGKESAAFGNKIMGM